LDELQTISTLALHRPEHQGLHRGNDEQEQVIGKW
jgi:hypothetical protein